MPNDRGRGRSSELSRISPWLEQYPLASRWVLAFVTAALLGALMVDWSPRDGLGTLKVGAVATHDVRAIGPLEIRDDGLTAERRRGAREQVPSVFEHDAFLGRELKGRVGRAFAEARGALARLEPDPAGASAEEVVTAFARALALELRDVDQANLIDARFDVGVEQDIVTMIRDAMAAYVLFDRSELPGIPPILVVRREGAAASDDLVTDWGEIQSLPDIRARISARAAETLGARPPHLLDTAVAIARDLVQPNLRFDASETEVRRDRAAASVAPVTHPYQSGQIILRSGELVTPWTLTVVDTMQEGTAAYRPVVHHLSLTLLFMLCLVLVERYADRYVAHFRRRFKDLLAMNALLLLVAGMAALLRAIGTDLQTPWPGLPGAAWGLALPVASGAIILRTLLNGETAAGWAIVAAIVCGGIMDGDLYMAVVYLLASVAGAGGVDSKRERSRLLLAGLRSGLAAMGVVLTVHLSGAVGLPGEGWGQEIEISTVISRSLFALLGGVLSGVLALGLTPVFESMGFLTEARLLELANLNHPLLREMIVKAPGTYHHSMMVGALAEAAAEATGANSLLLRVGAYFHDIGKIAKPLYFIENQQGGDNPHDRLTPSMSALVIVNHVKEGIELGRQHRLPESIVDLIPQHHGTSIVSFFFNKAKQQEDSDKNGPVEDSAYRYPGPRPQTREAGIMMLADAVEAATRSLSTHTQGTLSQRVEQVANRAIADGQLDDCPLTLRDLRTVADTFVRVLMGIYHHRIEYPQPPQPGRAGRPKGLPASSITLEMPPLGVDPLAPHPLALPESDADG